MTTNFPGFSRQAVQFYEQLENDNTREFWAAHKETYESQVRAPMEALLAGLEGEFGAGRVFRPYRNLRFSKDKTPYKTAQGAFVGTTVGLGYYVAIDADGLLAGGGFRSHGADQVARYRVAVDGAASGTELSAIVDSLVGGGFDIEGEQLRSRPRGVPADHPRLDLLRRTSLMAVRRFGTPSWLATSAALDQVRDTWRALRPLTSWVSANVEER